MRPDSLLESITFRQLLLHSLLIATLFDLPGCVTTGGVVWAQMSRKRLVVWSSLANLTAIANGSALS